MPTYEYHCPKCGFCLEISHSINSDPNQSCMVCLEDMVKGPGGGCAVHFKGSGFYETDYKNK